MNLQWMNEMNELVSEWNERTATNEVSSSMNEENAGSTNEVSTTEQSEALRRSEAKLRDGA